MARTAAPLQCVSHIREQQATVPQQQRLGIVASVPSAAKVLGVKVHHVNQDASQKLSCSSPRPLGAAPTLKVGPTPRHTQRSLSIEPIRKVIDVCENVPTPASSCIIRARELVCQGVDICDNAPTTYNTHRIRSRELACNVTDVCDIVPTPRQMQKNHSSDPMSKLMDVRDNVQDAVATFEAQLRNRLLPVNHTEAPLHNNLQVSDLRVGSEPFDPLDASVKPTICKALCIDESTIIEGKRRIGGCNEGIWFVNAPTESLILKLVKSTAIFSDMPSEAECYRRLYRKYPSVMNDSALGFPHHIFRIVTNGSHAFDLIAMKRMPGRVLSDWMQEKWRAGLQQEVFLSLEKVGRALAEFKGRYGVDHGDMQPMNVIYDDVSNTVGFIDLSSMGGVNGCCVVESDVEHFTKAVALMAECVGEDLKNSLDYFQRGLQKVAAVGSADAILSTPRPTPRFIKNSIMSASPVSACSASTPSRIGGPRRVTVARRCSPCSAEKRIRMVEVMG